MPYKSSAQQRFLHAVYPDIAARWDKETDWSKKLPKRIKKKKVIEEGFHMRPAFRALIEASFKFSMRPVIAKFEQSIAAGARSTPAIMQGVGAKKLAQMERIGTGLGKKFPGLETGSRESRKKISAVLSPNIRALIRGTRKGKLGKGTI